MDEKRRKFLKYLVFLVLAIPIIGFLGKLKPFEKIINEFKPNKIELEVV